MSKRRARIIAEGQRAPNLSSVVPAKAGTHTPCRHVKALWLTLFFNSNARGYGFPPSRGRLVEAWSPTRYSATPPKSVDGQLNPAQHLLVGDLAVDRFLAVLLQQFHLHVVERIEIGKAVADRAFQQADCPAAAGRGP